MPSSSFILHPSSFRLACPERSRRAFTLTELMISVALALLLLVGINQVFKSTSQTVGTTYASLEGNRKQLSLSNVLSDDLSKAVPVTDQPFILIHSEAIPQYWDASDANADRDSNVYTVDLDGDGKYTSAGEDISTNGTGVADSRSGRSHRADRFSFFARDKNNPFHRQTGDVRLNTDTADRLVSDESSSEAWLWYGFLRMPDNGSNLSPLGAPTGDYYSPAQIDTNTSQPFTPQKNQNNYYAKDWALGRQAILLAANPAHDYISPSPAKPASPAPPLSPLAPDSEAYSTTLAASSINPVINKPWLMAHSRYDIAQTTLRSYRTTLKTYQDRQSIDASLAPWYQILDYPFNAKPWTDPTATTANGQSAEMANTVPFLTRGCSQFIVEFAGDFCTQTDTPGVNGDGNVTSNAPDGKLDWVTDPNTLQRQVRWYGFPRDISGPSGAADGLINWQYDVIPVRDVLGHFGVAIPSATNTTPAPAWFEVTFPTGTASQPVTGNYPALARGAQYVCAWGPNDLTNNTNVAPSSSNIGTQTLPTSPGPWLVRIVLNVRDPNGRLPNGQQSEYVFNFQPNK